MKGKLDECEALKALFSALFPPSEALLVLDSSYSTAEEMFHMETGLEVEKNQVFSKYLMYSVMAGVG